MSDLKCTAKEEKILREKAATNSTTRDTKPKCGCACAGSQELADTTWAAKRVGGSSDN